MGVVGDQVFAEEVAPCAFEDHDFVIRAAIRASSRRISSITFGATNGSSLP